MSYIGDFKRLTPGRQAIFLVGMVFALIYFSLGVACLFIKNLPFVKSPALKIAFGVILIVYSVFRLARLAGSLKDA